MGRARGTPNKSSMRVDLTCQAMKYYPIEKLIEASKIVLEKFIEHSEKEASGQISLMESQAAEYMKIYVLIAKEIAGYIHPKRKAIEYTQPDATQGMTPIQRLEAMKQAVLMLELKMKEEDAAPKG